MDIERQTRQSRKSPINYFPESSRKTRSRKKSAEPVSRKLNANDSFAVEKPRRRSRSRNAKSPTRKKKMVTDEINEKLVKKNSSPVHPLKSKSSKLEEIIRSSITPDRAKIEEVIRSSVSRFEEVIAEVAPSIKLRSKASTKVEKVSVENERVEYMPALKKNELSEKEMKTTSVINKTNNNNNNQITMNETYKEFGGTIGVLLLMFFLPVVVIVAHILCSQDNCKSFPTKFNLTLQRFFDLDGSLWYLGFLLIQFLVSPIPLGPRLYGTGSNGICLGYWRNGPASLLLSILLLGGVKYYLDFPLIKVLDKALPILVTAIFTALIIAVLLYFVSSKVKLGLNPCAHSGSFIYDMWIGREINPKLGPCDIKITLIRNCLLTTIIINCCLILKNVETNSSEYSTILLLISTLQIIFAIDNLICESSLVSSFVVTQEGTGFNLIMTLTMIPFWITLLPKHIYYSKSEFNLWIALTSIVMYLLGHIIYRISSLQNDKFQRNPFLFKSSDVLYSRHSEKIFRGGLRLKIRYPEYSGLLLVIASWCVPCLYAEPLHWVPLSQIFFSLTMLIMHTKRLDNKSSTKHNHVWGSYVSQTSAIIPYIY